MTETTPNDPDTGDEPDGLDPQEQLSHPDAEPAESDPTGPERQPSDVDWVEPAAEATRPTKSIL